MAKCDVCGKVSLIPERIGNVSICKVCFMRINGPMWKYLQYDKRENVANQKDKIITSAKQQGFPENVLTELSNFFDKQLNSMYCCDVCGSSVQNLNLVGKAKLCKKCYVKIDKEAWRECEYSDNNKVEENRAKILKIANKNYFPQVVLDGINESFDRKIQKGLIDTVYGENQKLKVFETHCVLETYGNFDEEEMSKRYAKLLRKSGNGAGLLSNGIAQVLVRSALGGGILKTGVSLAKSAVVNVAADAVVDAFAPNRASFRVRKGSVTIEYDYYDIVDFQRTLTIGYEDELGYMRFRNSQQSVEESNSLIFFFDSNYSAEKMYNYICDRIEQEKKNNIDKTSNQYTNGVTSIADEILKFKQLLDLGAITEEEYLEKKKELLNK